MNLNIKTISLSCNLPGIVVNWVKRLIFDFLSKDIFTFRHRDKSDIVLLDKFIKQTNVDGTLVAKAPFSLRYLFIYLSVYMFIYLWNFSRQSYLIFLSIYQSFYQPFYLYIDLSRLIYILSYLSIYLSINHIYISIYQDLSIFYLIYLSIIN